MDGWLKALVAGACIVVIAGGGYYAWTEYERASIARLNEAARQRVAIESRAQELATEGCRPQVEELLRLHAERPIASASDVRGDLRRDISICLSHDIAFAFEKNELERTGLAQILRN
ncbi:hypothetical protein GOC68_22230 [Sinorhizobium medicae]|nr:hypothetical protein [Sinorhizobium medicae]